MTKKDKIILGLIVLLALVLRLWQLDKFPYGFHFDEAKAAWNAVSIGLTGQDDHGNKLPMYYDSFGDFRPTGIIYLIIPFVLSLGRSVWAVRLPVAIIGALSSLGMFVLAGEVAKEKKIKFGLWAAFFMAINPWHVSVSRATSEVIVAMFLLIFGLYFLIRTLRSNSWKWGMATILTICLSYFFYHSIRILAPMFGVLTVAYFGFSEKNKFKKMMWALGVVVILGIASSGLMLAPEARGRLSQVSLKSDFQILYETQKGPNEDGPNNVLVARAFHNKITVLLRRFGEEYFSYLGTDFLVGRAAKPQRYMTTNFGLITYVELALLLMGIAAMVTRKELKWAGLAMLLAPLPAAVTMEDVPNMHRSMMMVPFLVLMIAGGMSLLVEKSNKFIVLVLLGGLAAHMVYYLHFYYSHGNYALSVYSRNGGLMELGKKLDELRKEHDRVIVTNYSDNPYAWYAYFSGKDPGEFNSKYKKNENGMYEYENIVFSNERCPTNFLNDEKTRSNYKNSLLINGEGCEVNPDLVKKLGLVKIDNVERLDESEVAGIWVYK